MSKTPDYPHVYDDISQTIGETPLVRLRHMAQTGQAVILAKIEGMNPAWSVKDRIARAMIDAAERDGLLKEGMAVVEATSGNTGIGLAMVCAARGYRLKILMPEDMSQERQKLIVALGAQLVLTPAAEGMTGAVGRATQLASESGDHFMPSQFTNPANPRTHEETTGEEIWRDTGGNIDVLVAGVGTGGTLTGIARLLKSRQPAIHVVAVEPAKSPVMTQTRDAQTLQPGRHGIQGIGAGFIPETLEMDLVDEVLQVTDSEAIDAMRSLARREGILAGISSGAALAAAGKVAARSTMKGKTIVTILPDLGERYLSTGWFD